MALGDVVEGSEVVSPRSVLKIKPPATEEWTIHNIYHSGACALIKCKLIQITGENVGTGDGVTTTFYLANPPVEEESEEIYVDGVLQTKGTDYTIDYETGQINFTTAPPSGATITANYQHRREIQFDQHDSAGAWLFFSFGLKNDHYIRAKNIDTVDIKIAYDGKVTGPNA